MAARGDVLLRRSGGWWGPMGTGPPGLPAVAEVRSGGMATLFTRIIDGDIPATFVWRDERCVAFMSINPLTHGHVLVVPIDEVDHWVDAPADLLAHVFEVARVLGIAQRRAFGCERIGLIIAGYEVPHTHVHVVPTNAEAELSFSNAAATVGREELDAGAEAILTELRAMGRREVV